ncbi:MAG: hypothetical protein A3C50_04170 [Candidatus Staskawiczbacteria bacterium RIFCSPHIGHO2_02_FULL_43_16]|nr:MAG: hypothetical protein A3C50_04170 [Candidatus Staskawiczbacteria bacterium RIFCSPHIGHO2_02_FULL_43_16]
MGSSSIDLSLSNLWRSWFAFKRGKKSTQELERFNYYLEENLYSLHQDLNVGTYKHQPYKKFIAVDNKRREILVASIRDRVVHRLMYQYLVDIYDQTFIFDVWSCRKEKGLTGAIERTQDFLNKYPRFFVWRSDVKKFFDNINHRRLLDIISLRVSDKKAVDLLKEIIKTYAQAGSVGKGIPIGNLTSQIFANIYLNELDRFIKHLIKPIAYLRYGDDFIIISENVEKLKEIREATIRFLEDDLFLKINGKSDIIVKAKWGLKFLGVKVFPKGRRLNNRNLQRIHDRISLKNVSSYAGLLKKHSNTRKIKYFNWLLLEKFFNDVN